MKLTPLFTRQDTEVISQEVLYQGFFRMEKLQLRHRTFAGDWTPVLLVSCSNAAKPCASYSTIRRAIVWC